MTARSAASLQGQIMAVVQHESAQFLVTSPNPAPSLPTPWHEHGVEAQTRIKRGAGQRWLERLRPVDPTAGVAADLARFLQSTYKVQVVGAAGRTTDRPPEEAAAVARDRAGLLLYVLSMGWGVHPPARGTLLRQLSRGCDPAGRKLRPGTGESHPPAHRESQRLKPLTGR